MDRILGFNESAVEGRRKWDEFEANVRIHEGKKKFSKDKSRKGKLADEGSERGRGFDESGKTKTGGKEATVENEDGEAASFVGESQVRNDTDRTFSYSERSPLQIRPVVFTFKLDV